MRDPTCHRKVTPAASHIALHRHRAAFARMARVVSAVLMVAMVVVLVGCGASVVPAAGEVNAGNLVTDGAFASLNSWTFSLSPASKATFSQDHTAHVGGEQSLHVQVTAAPPAPWLIQAVQHNIHLRQAQHLYLTFNAKGDAGTTLDATLLPQSSLKNQSPEFADLYALYQVDLSQTWQRYVADVIPIVSDDSAVLTFNFGTAVGNIWLDDVQLSPEAPAGLPWSAEMARGLAGSASSGVAPSLQGWKLLWQDDFSGPTLNTRNWSVVNDAGGYQNASLRLGTQYWTPSALSIANGMLTITAQPQSVGGKAYVSGALTTENKFAFKYGRVDIRANMPYGDGLWTAFWLLPVGQTIKSDTTQEIDMLEYLGQAPGKPYFAHHYGFSGDEWCTFKGSYMSQGYHVYTLEWTAQALDDYIDGVHRCHVTAAIPATPMYLLMDMAVGGNFPIPVDSKTTFPQHTMIDYVHVYQQA